MLYYYFYSGKCECKRNKNKILENKKSQFNQDISLFYYFFQNKYNGIFLEIGAYDGISLSNTYFFEKNFNWEGLLIEGGEKNCKNLLRNSKYRNRSKIICCPICNSMFINFNDEGYYGKIQKIDTSKKKYVCNTLRNITSFYNIKHIDLFSLDVEGSELEVLETFDFNVTVDIFIIEWGNLNRKSKEKITHLLYSNGYHRIPSKTYISPIDVIFSSISIL